MKVKKILFRILLIGLAGFLSFASYNFYRNYKRNKIRAPYYENIVNTASPTVTVLRDSIPLEYRDEKKTLHVYVPPDYEKDSMSRYPVIYMLDGASSFNDLEIDGPEWQIDEVINAAASRNNQTAIVIGVSSANDRDAEYTPFINEDNPNAHGAQFSVWLTTKLKDWVDSNYRTRPDLSSTTIAGISRSGMMAYYMIMAHPETFGNAIIQSPAMWVDHERLMAMEISSNELEGKKVFVSVGEYEGNIMVPHAEGIYEKFKAKGMDENRLRFQIIEDEGHWNLTWRKSFAFCYPWLMQG